MPPGPHAPPVGSRGFTLTEVMVVVVLAGVVTLGLVAFYLNAQAMWMAASTQALAQRDATSILEYMRQHAHEAASAEVLPNSPDSLNHRVIFYNRSHEQMDSFSWEPDSLLHHGVGISDTDEGPVAGTIVERFHASYDPGLGLVTVDTLRVRSSSGQRVTLSTAIGLFNQ